jgi:hypothetical protein
VLAADTPLRRMIYYFGIGHSPTVLLGPETEQGMLFQISKGAPEVWDTYTRDDINNFAADYAFTPTVKVKRNASSEAGAPPTIMVDLATYNGAGVEISRVRNLSLFKDLAISTPDYLIYRLPDAKPFVILDLTLPAHLSQDFYPLLGTPDGTLGVLPATSSP